MGVGAMVVGCAGGMSGRVADGRPGRCFSSEDDDGVGNPSMTIP